MSDIGRDWVTFNVMSGGDYGSLTVEGTMLSKFVCLGVL